MLVVHIDLGIDDRLDPGQVAVDPGVDARLALGAPTCHKASQAHLVPQHLLAGLKH